MLFFAISYYFEVIVIGRGAPNREGAFVKEGNLILTEKGVY